jgi:hypothetical protein
MIPAAQNRLFFNRFSRKKRYFAPQVFAQISPSTPHTTKSAPAMRQNRSSSPSNFPPQYRGEQHTHFPCGGDVAHGRERHGVFLT